MTKQNQEEYESVKLMFLTKKSKLVGIINELKEKVNGVNINTNHELKLKETIL